MSKIKKYLIDPSIGHFVLQNSFISQYLPSPFDLRAGNHYLQCKADSVRASGLRSVFHADPLGQASIVLKIAGVKLFLPTQVANDY
jgi:hypothetical protein